MLDYDENALSHRANPAVEYEDRCSITMEVVKTASLFSCWHVVWFGHKNNKVDARS